MDLTRVSFRAAICASVAVLAALGLAACGSDEDSQALTFELTTEGKESVFTVPESAGAGEAEITLVNNAEGDGDMQLIRVEGDHTPEEVVEGLGDAQSGKPFPDWFFAGGGTGPTPAGDETTVTQVLEPGTYYAFDTEGAEGPPRPENLTGMEVTGEASEDELEGDVTVSAFDYGFNADGLKAGENEIVFSNEGDQPHHLLAFKLLDGKMADDVETFFKTEKGEPPIEEDFSGTAVVEGGESQLATLDLDQGNYALVCFISDRQGGPPHIAKGMLKEVEVE